MDEDCAGDANVAGGGIWTPYPVFFELAPALLVPSDLSDLDLPGGVVNVSASLDNPESSDSDMGSLSNSLGSGMTGRGSFGPSGESLKCLAGGLLDGTKPMGRDPETMGIGAPLEERAAGEDPKPNAGAARGKGAGLLASAGLSPDGLSETMLCDLDEGRD